VGNLTAIRHDGEIVAVVLGDRAVITPGLEPRKQYNVQAMCLYALGIDSATRAESYNDDDALAYANHARASRVLA
jgi:hypothetical protein